MLRGLFFYFRQFTDSILELYTTQSDIIILIMALDIILGRLAMLYINNVTETFR